ncbi:MAG: hypothetical protein DMF69_00865 [Acidobacteria bacterium]|nr:MAG: hypothetical protein DMF69_00865 [Acidobacteriota bacterium]
MKTTNRRKEIITLIVVFVGVLLISALAVYLIGNNQRPAPVTQTEQVGDQGSKAVEPDRTAERRSTPANQQTGTFFDRIFGTQNNEAFLQSERWVENVGRLALRLMLAAVLGAALAFRPRKRSLALKPNPYVSQTQILLAIVAAALMIIVGDNAARAFGIFAAVSLVRFRTNIRDPKEITVLLISLALGLAAGVGRWDLAFVLTGFSLIVLWLMEWREPQLISRSMEVKVSTRNGFDAELRTLDRDVTEESPGSLIFAVDISPTVTTDELSEDILRLDGRHVEGIVWDQKKSYSYLYQ